MIGNQRADGVLTALCGAQQATTGGGGALKIILIVIAIIVGLGILSVGAFSFFAAFALYLLLAGRAAPKKALAFFGVFGMTMCSIFKPSPQVFLHSQEYQKLSLCFYLTERLHFPG